MKEKERLFNVIKEINTKEIKTEKDKLDYNILVQSLWKELHTSGWRTVRNDSGKDEEIFRIEWVPGETECDSDEGDVNFIIKYKWNYPQLNTIYHACRVKYCSEDLDLPGRIYRQNLNQCDVVNIMCEIIADLKDFRFNEVEEGAEGQLVNYLKKRINGACQDEWNRVNKLYEYNNFKLYSYDHITEELTETLDMADKYNSYKNMFNIEFDYYKNINIREVDLEKDSQEYRQKIYFNWVYSLWDSETILSEKNLKLGEDNYKKKMNKLKEWRIWATEKQKEKIGILLNELEQGENLFTYSNKGYVLNLKRVGEILYPDRVGNCNKDIYNFIDSLKNRFNKYIA